MLRHMRMHRIVALFAAAAMLSACTPEPTASQLTAKGITNLTSAQTVHLEGTGSLALKEIGRAHV